MKNKKQIISVCVAFFSFGLALTALAWTGPTAAPPGNNTMEPINASNNTQTKYGFFNLPKLFDSNDESYYVDPDTNSWLYRLYSHDIRSSIFYDNDNTDYYVDPASTSKFNIINFGGEARTTWPGGGDSLWFETGTDIYRSSGNVGIGTTAPGAKLEVIGNIIADAPVNDNHLATKAYVDAAESGGGSPGDWDCAREFLLSNNGGGSVLCSDGRKLITGGCRYYGAGGVGALKVNAPSVAGNGWECQEGTFTTQVGIVAWCCK